MRSLPPKGGDGTPGGGNYMGGMYNQNSQGLAGAQNNMAKPRMGGYAGLGGNNFGSYSVAAQGEEPKLPSITNRQALGIGGLYKKKDTSDAPKPSGAVGGFPGVNKYGAGGAGGGVGGGGMYGLGGYGRHNF